jgi:hypothetical protein
MGTRLVAERAYSVMTSLPHSRPKRRDEVVGRPLKVASINFKDRWAEQPSLRDDHLVDVAPAPVFVRFERPNDRVMGRMKMLRGVLVFGAVATTHVPAGKTQSQVNPSVAHLQTFFATVAARLHIVNRAQMLASLRHDDTSHRALAPLGIQNLTLAAKKLR